jgi:glutamate 5-kinase
MSKSDGLKNIEPKFKRIVIKVGSNVLTRNDGSVNEWRISRLAEDLSILYRWGIEVILVTSGAVAAGRNEVTLSKKVNIISARQVWASIGQVKLMSFYQNFFGKFNIPAGQVLATKESFGDRRHYLNMKNCISAMLENRIIPIVNENDTIAIDELMFTDNDELSGLIASMMDCTSLIILTNVDGIFRGDPASDQSELIREVNGDNEINRFISSLKSTCGRGGMGTKCSNAMKIASEGIEVFIANGNRDAIIIDIVRDKNVPFTRFSPGNKREKSIKKWLSHSETFTRGSVIVNKGAKEALLSGNAKSLLMIGISDIEGTFMKGDIVMILGEDKSSLGLGKSQYDSSEAQQYIGVKVKKPIIHYDYMVINDKMNGSSY